VAAVSAAVLASIGLEALGLGPIDSPTLGMTIYWAILDGAVINRWWWWWVPPIAAISILFLGLFLLSMGLDEIANPRVRERI
jgi:peptide/nickel transport system permease protein